MVNTDRTQLPPLPFVGLAVAVAFVGVGHVGPWVALAWAAIFTLMRSSETARRSAFMGPLFVAVIAGALAWPNYILVAAVFLLTAIVGLPLNLALDQLEERNPKGLIVLAIVWLLGPSAAGAAALVAAAYLNASLRQRGAQRVHSPRAVWPVVLVAAAFALGTLLLPRPPALLERITASLNEENVMVRGEAPRSGLFGAPLAGGMLPGLVTRQPAPTVSGGNREDSLGPLLAIMAVPLVLMIAILIGRRLRFGRGRRPGWLDAVEVIALAGSFAGLLLLAFAWSRTRYVDGEGGAGTAGGVNSGTFDGIADGLLRLIEQIRAYLMAFLDRFGTSVALLMLLGSFLGLALLAYGVWVLTRTRADRDHDEYTSSTSGAPAVASNRVRLAYAQMLHLVRARGAVRRVAETPGEFARRAGNLLPAASNDIAALTGLYVPVRYGRRITDEHAEHAEAALARIENHLRDHSSDRAIPHPDPETP